MFSQIFKKQDTAAQKFNHSSMFLATYWNLIRVFLFSKFWVFKKTPKVNTHFLHFLFTTSPGRKKRVDGKVDEYLVENQFRLFHQFLGNICSSPSKNANSLDCREGFEIILDLLLLYL
jgi:hypothetical protein